MTNAAINRRKNSGQVLVITSLVVVLLLLSTVVYVTETEKTAPVYHPEANVYLSAIKQAAFHTAMSAMVNISNGGDPTVLTEDLIRLKSAVQSRSYDAISDLKFSVTTSAPYIDGVFISWAANGEGVSSVSVNLVLNSTGFSTSYYSQYGVNVTSSVKVKGDYTQLNESVRQIIMSCTVLNEDSPGQAENLELYYQRDNPGGWIEVASPEITSLGNGTYLISFTTRNTTQSVLPVSLHCQDARGISVWATATCTQE
jgi:hypothetical protein